MPGQLPGLRIPPVSRPWAYDSVSSQDGVPIFPALLRRETVDEGTLLLDEDAQGFTQNALGQEGVTEEHAAEVVIRPFQDDGAFTGSDGGGPGKSAKNSQFSNDVSGSTQVSTRSRLLRVTNTSSEPSEGQRRTEWATSPFLEQEVAGRNRMHLAALRIISAPLEVNP